MSNVYIFPTDTVFGIGAKLFDLESLKLIYEFKQRPLDKKIAVLISDIKQIKKFAKLNKEANLIIENYFPGPLTLILKSKRKYRKIYQEDTVGIRMPNCRISLNLIDDLGPLKTTSVNLNNEPPLNKLSEIKKVFNDSRITYYDFVMDKKSSMIPSTVIDLTKPSQIKLIREGSIKFNEIINFINSKR